MVAKLKRRSLIGGAGAAVLDLMRPKLAAAAWPSSGKYSNIFQPPINFAGVVNGGFYVAAWPTNTLAQFVDISGLGNNMTQSVAANQFDGLTSGFKNAACYKSTLLGNHPAFFNLPAITTHTQSFGFWCAFRARSMQPGGSRAVVSFGPNLTDCMFEFTAGNTSLDITPNLRIWNGPQNPAIGGDSSISILIVSSSASTIIVNYNDWPQYTGSALSSLSLTGGFAFKRMDGFDLNGEVYEFGLIDRPFSPAEITAIQSRFNGLYRQRTPSLGRLCIIGDSLSEGQAASIAMLSWTSLVDDQMAGNYVQSSYAQSGSYIGHGSSAWGLNPSQGINVFNSGYSKNIALAFIGTNDLATGVAGGDPATTVFSNLKLWTTAMKSAGFKIVVCTITPRNDAQWSGAKETQRLAYNTSILTEPTFDAVVDLASVSALSNPNDGVHYTSDFLHFKDPGEQAVANAVLPVVLAL